MAGGASGLSEQHRGWVGVGGSVEAVCSRVDFHKEGQVEESRERTEMQPVTQPVLQGVTVAGLRRVGGDERQLKASGGFAEQKEPQVGRSWRIARADKDCGLWAVDCGF